MSRINAVLKVDETRSLKVEVCCGAPLARGVGGGGRLKPVMGCLRAADVNNTIHTFSRGVNSCGMKLYLKANPF